MSTDLTDTRVDAEHAYCSVAGLEELLREYPQDKPLTTGHILGLIVSIRAHMENVVDGLRIMSRVGVTQ